MNYKKLDILFLGPYRQKYDGWGVGALAWLNSLSKTGHNISAKPIYLSNDSQFWKDDLDPELVELENNKFTN